MEDTLGDPRYRDLLAVRVFARLFSADVISFAGDALSRIAVPVYVFELTGDPAALGVAFAVQQIPWVLGTPLAGVLADRYRRKTLMLGSALAEGVALLLLIQSKMVGVVFAWLLVAAIMRVIRTTAVQAVLPDVLDARLYPKGIAARIVAVQATDIGGMVVGGALAASLGAATVVAADAATFVFYGLLLVSLPIPAQHRASTEQTGTILSDLREGARFAAQTPTIRFVVAVMVVRGMTFMAVLPLMFAFVENNLGATALEYGLIAGAGSAGIVLGSVLGSRSRGNLTGVFLLTWASAMAGVVLIALGPVRSVLVVIPLYFLASVAHSGGNLVANVSMAQAAPSELRGRALGSAWAIIKLAQVIAAAAAGVAASIAGVPTVLVVAGSVLAASTIGLRRGIRPEVQQQVNAAVSSPKR